MPTHNTKQRRVIFFGTPATAMTHICQIELKIFNAKKDLNKMPICVNVVQECPSLPQDKLAMDDDSSNTAG
jgi:hypothetical protein